MNKTHRTHKIKNTRLLRTLLQWGYVLVATVRYKLKPCPLPACNCHLNRAPRKPYYIVRRPGCCSNAMARAEIRLAIQAMEGEDFERLEVRERMEA